MAGHTTGEDDARRATLASVKDGGDGRPQVTWSLTLSRAQTICSIIAYFIAVLGAAAGAAAWVGEIYIGREFDERLLLFHEVAKPGIRQMVEQEIQNHDVVRTEGLTVMRERLTVIETHAEGTDLRLQRIEDLVWAIYTSQLGTTRLPPRSPNGH